MREKEIKMLFVFPLLVAHCPAHVYYAPWISNKWSRLSYDKLKCYNNHLPSWMARIEPSKRLLLCSNQVVLTNMWKWNIALMKLNDPNSKFNEIFYLYTKKSVLCPIISKNKECMAISARNLNKKILLVFLMKKTMNFND